MSLYILLAATFSAMVSVLFVLKAIGALMVATLVVFAVLGVIAFSRRV